MRYRKKSKDAEVKAPQAATMADATVKLPAALEDAILTGRCILFLGAGSSRPAGAPGWRRLLEDVAHKFCPQNVPRIEKYFSRNDPWGAADLACAAAPRPELETF